MYSDILPLCIADVPYLMSDVVNKTEFDVRGLLVGRKMTGVGGKEAMRGWFQVENFCGILMEFEWRGSISS